MKAVMARMGVPPPPNPNPHSPPIFAEALLRSFSATADLRNSAPWARNLFPCSHNSRALSTSTRRRSERAAAACRLPQSRRPYLQDGGGGVGYVVLVYRCYATQVMKTDQHHPPPPPPPPTTITITTNNNNNTISCCGFSFLPQLPTLNWSVEPDVVVHVPQ